MTSFDVLTVGEPMALFSAAAPGPLDEILDWHRSTAGAELNVAIGLARLGMNVGYLTRIGADSFGRSIRSAMHREGVGCDLVRTDASRPTGLMLKSLAADGSDPVIEYHRQGSAASFLGLEDAPTEDCSFRLLHLTGIGVAISRSLRELVFHIARQARERGRIVAFDPNLRPTLWPSPQEMTRCLDELAGHADVMLPGLAEGQLLTGMDRPADIAAYYFARGVRQVLIKLGAQGAYAAEPGEPGEFVAGVAVDRVVDTVGAGDGFAVGVISALLEGTSLREAAARGNAIGARVVQFPGDSEGLPTRRQLQGLLA